MCIRDSGPRYCPSIEDKIDRFAERDRHQLFVEPEGWDTVEVYVNGFSSSLPEDVQFKALRKVQGFEHCKFFRPGYAIEYDFFQPTQLRNTLETKLVDNLFFAGQINGKTGYEEAAGQGLVAGFNAHLKINEQDPFILKRSEAYIGVLIDDLVHKGTKEPYRMFTSRAEYRILLRQDNADIRLSRLADKIGADNMTERLVRVEEKENGIAAISKFIENLSVEPGTINPYLEAIDSAAIPQKLKLINILKRPGVSLDDLQRYVPALKDYLSSYDAETINIAEISAKYSGYIKKEQEQVDKMNRLENVRIKSDVDYHTLSALSSEAREKLTQIRPETIGQASRISGVSPADVSILLVYMGR